MAKTQWDRWGGGNTIPTNNEPPQIIQGTICSCPSCKPLFLLQNLKAKCEFSKFRYLLSLHHLPPRQLGDRFLVLPVSNTDEKLLLWSLTYSTSPNFIIYLLFISLWYSILGYKYNQMQQNQLKMKRPRIKCGDGWVRKPQLNIVCAMEHILSLLFASRLKKELDCSVVQEQLHGILW